MKFVFVSAMRSYPWGGSEELWSQAATHLHEQGHEVTVSTPWWPRLSPKVESLAARGIRLVIDHPPPETFSWKLWQKIKRRVTKPHPERFSWLDENADLICVSNGNYSDGLAFLEASHRAGVPFVSIVQANAEFIWPSDAEAGRIAAVYRAAGGVYFVSASNRSLLETQLGMRIPQAQVVRNPFNVSWNAAPAWPDDAKSWRLACVARLEPPAKGQDILFRVLASEKWRSRPLRVTLFGEGSMAQGLRRLASELGLQDQVEFAGQTDKIETVWANHHALVLPSRYEGLPLALVEAMLCGRPGIVTDIGGNAELVDDEISGFVAAAPTVRLLDEAMERAWQKREQWREMGAAARRRAEKEIPKDPALVFAGHLLAVAKAAKDGPLHHEAVAGTSSA